MINDVIVEKLHVAGRQHHFHGDLIGNFGQQIKRRPLIRRKRRNTGRLLGRFNVGARIMACQPAGNDTEHRQIIDIAFTALFLAKTRARIGLIEQRQQIGAAWTDSSAATSQRSV